ncbi:hypothetical protein GCM10027155_07180 [Acinetobacter apis]|uniref:Uncharacterized protein n=1 Tax=Acinetobacter apis TaxID=1229165 RepID=A0A217EE81_9GAMM|nr:hypothetical protein [Acinetobacter apis]SNQ28801.1 hypothetical protein SAMN05444584_0728 [Acinetobacter apis]
MGCSKLEESAQSQQETIAKEPSQSDLAKAQDELIKSNPSLAPATNNLTPEQAKQAAQKTYDNPLNEKLSLMMHLN